MFLSVFFPELNIVLRNIFFFNKVILKNSELVFFMFFYFNSIGIDYINSNNKVTKIEFLSIIFLILPFFIIFFQVFLKIFTDESLFKVIDL